MKQAATTKRGKMRTVGSIAFYGILAIIVVAAIMFATSPDEKKSIFGYRFYEVLSGSMQPTIDVGELVIVKLVDPQDVKVGDIVTKSVSANGAVTVTHRVIDTFVAPDGTAMVTTQGDNNDIADESIPAAAIIGTVQVHVPFVGHAVGFVKNNVLFCIFVVVAASVLVLALRVIFGKKPNAPTPEMMEKRAHELEEEAARLRTKALSIRGEVDPAPTTARERAIQQSGESSGSVVPVTRPEYPPSARQEMVTYDHETSSSQERDRLAERYDPSLSYIRHMQKLRLDAFISPAGPQKLDHHGGRAADLHNQTNSGQSPTCSSDGIPREPDPTGNPAFPEEVSSVYAYRFVQPLPHPGMNEPTQTSTQQPMPRQARTEFLKQVRYTVLKGIYDSHTERKAQTIPLSQHITASPYAHSVQREEGERKPHPVVPVE